MMNGKKDFIALSDYSAEELLALIHRADEIKKGIPGKGVPKPWEGKCLGMIFDKPSTRTRVSFEVGARQLGGQVVFLNRGDIQLCRGEPIKDTARILSRYVDGLVIRTYAHETVVEFARWASIPVINGLTDLLHPCQVLSDLFTLAEYGIDIRAMKAAWVGDGNNMANSWINAAQILGFKLVISCPSGYRPKLSVEADNIQITNNPKEAVKGVDVISTDVWASMGQESESSERRTAFADYQVNAELLHASGDHAVILHCLPAHLGEEITEDVFESDRSLVWDQAENRLYAQKAVLEELAVQRA
jgi:ornithine carbamoyltransferase